MASQVLSGTGNVTYTNNTGQNVRIVINYMKITNLVTTGFGSITVSFGGVSTPIRTYGGTIGRGIAGTARDTGSGGIASQNFAAEITGDQQTEGVPVELIIAPTETYSVVADLTGGTTGTPSVSIVAYNIVVIPEAG